MFLNDPEIPLLSIYPRNTKIQYIKTLCMPILIAALFTVGQNLLTTQMSKNRWANKVFIKNLITHSLVVKIHLKLHEPGKIIVYALIFPMKLSSGSIKLGVPFSIVNSIQDNTENRRHSL